MGIARPWLCYCFQSCIAVNGRLWKYMLTSVYYFIVMFQCILDTSGTVYILLGWRMWSFSRIHCQLGKARQSWLYLPVYWRQHHVPLQGNNKWNLNICKSKEISKQSYKSYIHSSRQIWWFSKGIMIWPLPRQETQDVEAMLVWCSPAVYDTVAINKPTWVNVLWCLGCCQHKNVKCSVLISSNIKKMLV